MNPVAVFVFNLCIMFSFLAFGITFERLTNQDLSLKWALVNGFLLENTLFYLISLPFMLFKLEFIPLFYIFTVIVVVAILYSVHCLWNKFYNNKKSGLYVQKSNTKFNFVMVIWAVIVIGIVVQLVNVIYLQHIDIDDSFYLAESNTALASNTVQKIDPASGMHCFEFTNQYRLVSYELLIAFWAKLLGLNVAYLCHTILPVMFIILYYLIAYLIGKEISKEKSYIFVLVVGLINLFSLKFDYWQSYFLMARSWQGKSVMAILVVPCLILYFLKISDRKTIQIKELVTISMCLFTGMSVSTIGVYFLPIMYFALVVAKFLKERKIGTFMKLCIPVLIIIPFVLLKAYIMLLKGNNGQSIVEQVTDNSILQSEYWELLHDGYWGKATFAFILFIVAILILLRFGSEQMKKILLYPDFVLLATFLNPVFMNIVSRKVTGIPVYWRLFWLLNIPFIFAASAVCLYSNGESITKYIKHIWLILICVTFIVQGQYIFSETAFSKETNVYKVSNTTINIVNAILNNCSDTPVLLLPENMSYEIRMVTGEIQIPINRYTEYNYSLAKKEDEYKELIDDLVKPLYVEKNIEGDSFERLTETNGINYVLVYKDMDNLQDILDTGKVIYEEETFYIVEK